MITYSFPFKFYTIYYFSPLSLSGLSSSLLCTLFSETVCTKVLKEFQFNSNQGSSLISMTPLCSLRLFPLSRDFPPSSLMMTNISGQSHTGANLMPIIWSLGTSCCCRICGGSTISSDGCWRFLSNILRCGMEKMRELFCFFRVVVSLLAR